VSDILRSAIRTPATPRRPSRSPLTRCSCWLPYVPTTLMCCLAPVGKHTPPQNEFRLSASFGTCVSKSGVAALGSIIFLPSPPPHLHPRSPKNSLLPLHLPSSTHDHFGMASQKRQTLSSRRYEAHSLQTRRCPLAIRLRTHHQIVAEVKPPASQRRFQVSASC
jgi:hypothetical protein